LDRQEPLAEIFFHQWFLKVFKNCCLICIHWSLNVIILTTSWLCKSLVGVKNTNRSSVENPKLKFAFFIFSHGSCPQHDHQNLSEDFGRQRPGNNWVFVYQLRSTWAQSGLSLLRPKPQRRQTVLHPGGNGSESCLKTDLLVWPLGWESWAFILRLKELAWAVLWLEEL
jgi:hypothetical protein